MHVDGVDLSAIQPMDVGQHFLRWMPAIREATRPFHSTPPWLAASEVFGTWPSGLRPFLNERGFREDKRTYD